MHLMVEGIRDGVIGERQENLNVAFGSLAALCRDFSSTAAIACKADLQRAISDDQNPSVCFHRKRTFRYS